MTISINTIYDFDTSSKDKWENSVVALSDSQAVVAWVDNTGSQLYATVLDISGTVITAGTSKAIGSAGALSGVEVVKLSSTKVLVAYATGAGDDPGKAVILDITAGPSFTAGTIVEFSANEVAGVSCTALSSTKCLAVWIDQDDVNKAKSIILDVSGSTITPGGTIYTIDSSACYNPDVDMLSATKAVCLYGDGGNSDRPTAVCLDVSGTVITVGTPAQCDTTSYEGTFGTRGAKAITAATSTKLVGVWQDVATGKIKGCVIDVSGSTVTPGTAVNLTAGTYSYDEYPSVAANSAAEAVLVYDDGNTDGKILSLAISGATLSSNPDEIIFDNGTPFFESIAKVSDNKFIICYYDNPNGQMFVTGAATVYGLTKSSGGIPGSLY